MKKINSLHAIILLIFMTIGSSVLITSCKDDPCDDVTCLNGGTCFDGNCGCPTEYEGVNCGTETRTKYVGIYNVTNDCFPGVAYSQSVSTSSSDVGKFLILDLGNEPGLNVVCTVDGSSSFEIENQTVTDDDGDVWTVNGSGTISGSNVTANITYNLQGVGTLTCNETWIKQ